MDSRFSIYTGSRSRKYDDEKPLNKNTPADLNFHRPIDDPAPYVVVVQGPCNVGKSLLIESLRKYYLTKGLPFVQGTATTTFPVTTASGKDIRLQFVECPVDINGMVDAAKYADVAILMVDAGYGFEMETFEFRNLLQVHGFPKVIGVLTHLDRVGVDEISEVKRSLEDHFRTEICEGAGVFSFGCLYNGLYEMSDIDELGVMLSDSQFLPMSWRAERPYVLVDRFEDVTSESVHGDKQSSRNLSLYGYLRGCDHIKRGAKVHIAGAGDFALAGVTRSYDPCPSEAEQSHFKDCKTGDYVRLDVHDVPSEMVENFDPCYPILVGGILAEEGNSGYMQVKLRCHSWRFDLLMTGAPITVSAGWRRYQTTAVYTKESENGQHQILNYTPEAKGCLAVFWGPLAPPGTKIVVVQDELEDEHTFRIMAKGVVLDFNRDAQILLKVEKLAIVVQPGGKTAHVRFAPELKIDKLIGAPPIQTKRGVWVKIDEAAGEGIVKCTFGDNIHMSDAFLFPVLATLVLPSLFKQLNLHLKPLEIAVVDRSMKDTIAATITAIAAAVAATIAAVDAAISVEDELPAVSYQEVAPGRQMLDLRRGVVIHDGERGFFSMPNPIESFYSSAKDKAIDKRKCWEISGELEEVIDDDAVRDEFYRQKYGNIQCTWEPVVFQVDARLPGESAVQSFLRRYGPQVPMC
ncbi:hypothetical protein MKW94_009930 [Papaver nudicaule]|uniref:Uncharacterized protein n=1 Tax=Papaver nudicaule TaxID=74823 RepID=A0AA41RJT6_PAPNU|nr:hypothetical protein [Papaver nudicaule]